ncbi:MAG: hypothetical protein M3N16_07765, partial [Actinomycetota bacterium]|nr:hypothetical protein [Actinomycetota bacterium]
MIEARLYRAAFIPAALALVVAMFSLEAPPPALPQGLAADVLFEGRSAQTTATRLVEAHPDRRPGTRGNRATAAAVGETLSGRGFQVAHDRFRAGGEDLVNVVARRPGASGRQIVVVAARDGDSVPDATRSGADTAALLELGRVFGARASGETLVLASVDGGTLGEAGARP